MKILTTPHPSLRQKASPVKSWDKKTDTQVKQMIRLLQKVSNPKGVGLAATQVGLNKRIFITNLDNQIQVIVNPKIISKSKLSLKDKYKTSSKRWLEGCLSMPGIWGFVNRPFSIKVRYQLPESLKVKKASLSDFAATNFQHELDHLNGILFTDHLLAQNGTLYSQTDSGLDPIELLER